MVELIEVKNGFRFCVTDEVNKCKYFSNVLLREFRGK